MNSPLERAQSYIARKWSPIPVPHRAKRPVIREWERLRITTETAPRYFNGAPQNIGVLLGEPSNYLVDLDMDWPEAARLAGHFLPETLMFGRATNPGSHALVRCVGAVTKKFQLPTEYGGMLLELRSTGCQTILPGSAHQDTGELIEFENDAPVAELNREELENLCGQWAAAAVLLHFWNEGSRDDLATTIAGTLLRAGWEAAEANRYIEIVATEAADEDLHDRLKAESVARALRDGKRVYGIPKLKEILGAVAAEKVVEWLEVKNEQTTSEVASGDVLLPSDHTTFIDAAANIFPRLADTGRVFSRGGTVVELSRDKENLGLVIVDYERFRSLLEELGRTKSWVVNHGKPALREKRCSVDSAKALLATRAAGELLPPISLVTRSSIITIDEHHQPITLVHGYNAQCGGVLVTSTVAPELVPLPEARDALLKLLPDFTFDSEGDKSRAIAAMITPAIRMGRLLEGPAPMTVLEADDSQAGKGYFLKMVWSIYGEDAYAVAQRDGGVGSFDESLSAAVLSGKPFIWLDNFWGWWRSTFFEMIVTAESHVNARVPYQGEVSVDVRGITFQLTSNGVQSSRDTVNRCSFVRIKKRPREYQFCDFPEGDLLAHVKAKQAYYLGCVHTVVRHWIEAGRPRTKNPGHDLRVWGGALDWIVREVFGVAPLMEGHLGVQERVANPALTWVRQVALAIIKTADRGHPMAASAIFELCETNDIKLPGAARELDDERGRQKVGKLMAQVFKQGDTVELDGLKIERVEEISSEGKPVRRYIFGEVTDPAQGGGDDASPF